MRARPPVLTLIAAATAIVVGTMMSPLAAQAATPLAATPHTTVANPATNPAKAPTVRSCAAAVKPGTMACMALRRTDIPGIKENALGPNATVSGITPANLDSAYKLSTTGGSGVTVAIVDAFNDPNIVSDLATYRSNFGLPACPATTCFKVLNESGAASPLPTNDSGWAGEESLDVDMVSAICPLCHIDLIEASAASDADLYAAEDTAASLANFVSNSWGGDESSSQTSDDSHFNHPGKAITVSSGDDATGAEYPATSQYVTAVGGTHLVSASNTRGWTETAWSDAGSGCSAYDPKPSWQTVTTSCSKRAEADVSAVADPATGVAVYETYGASGWTVYGGTSVSAPIIAAVYALAGTPASGTYAASYPYSHASNLFDVTSGSNGSCGAPICTAGTGWDGPTGLGTPNGTAAFTSTGGGGTALSANNPGNQSTATSTAVSLTLTASGGTSPYTWTATGLPTGLSISSGGVISGTTGASAGTFNVVATVHDAASGTASASFTWTITSGGGGGTCTAGQKLLNPGFESGTTSWTSTSGVIGVNGPSEPAHSGTYDAWMDGYGTTHTDSIAQTVTVATGCTATLSFYLHIDTAETTTTTAYDKLTVTVNGVTKATFSNLNHNTGYALETISLAGTTGSVAVKWSGVEDSSLQTSFVVDDTALNVS